MAQGPQDTVVYLYGIARGDAPTPPAALRGVDERPVERLDAAGLTALVSVLPAGDYADDVLNERLQDLGWVGARGVAHEQVLLWYAERGPLVPLSLFSLHRDRERVTRRLEDDAARLRALLAALEGRQEWGVKVWRTGALLDEHLDELSPALRALSEEMATAPPGRRFLLAKKRAALRESELRAASARVAQQIFAALRPAAERAVGLPIAAMPEHDRALTLHAAFLVPLACFDGFHRAVSEAASRYAQVGFDFELTGPWPAYHFSTLDDA